MERYKYNVQIYSKDIPYMTVLLIAVNVIIFICMEFSGSTKNVMYMYDWGAMYGPDVFDNGKWHLLVTSMFLHFGYEHLINNMFMLFILGQQLEKQYGKFKYLLTYFACGISGNLISGLVEVVKDNYVISAGASGAVFGIFGVLLIMIFKSRKRMGQVSAPRLAILFILMVFGNMQEGVDWMAHLGGAITGVALAAILYKPKTGDDLLNL